MKKLLIAFALFISATVSAQVQYGGVIRAQDNAGAIGTVKRNSDGLKVADSILAARIPQLTLVGTGLKVDGSSVTQPTSLSTDADNTASGTLGAAAQTVILITSSKSAASVTVSGTWAGTITFEASNDGVIWNSINAVAASTSFPQPTTTVNGLYRITPGGLLQMRVIMTIFTSGSASISMRASLGTAGIFANQILPTRITDGANTASIKPASTASATTDLPLIVALHPSSPTPNFLLAQTVTGTRLNNGTSNSSGSTHLTIGGSDGTNLKPLLVDVNGRPIVKLSDGTNSVGITSAAIGGNETTVDRLKVNASLRLLDVAQAAGSQLVAAKGDQTTGLWVNIKNTSVPVTGPFFQTTQPVSIATMPTTAVTGTFFQATQPVSGAFFQTTQPVSIATMPTTPVTGTFFQATQPVSLATNTPTLQAGSTTAVTQATAGNLNALVTQQAITKGTQGTNGITTQDLKDAGRNQVHYYMLIPVLTSATDALQSLTTTKGGATVAATVTPAVVTTGKILRITRVAATYISTATSGYGIVRLRFTVGGIVTITGNVAATLVVGNGSPTTVNASDSEEASLSEGWEFAAGTGIGVSVQGFAAATATAVGYVLVSVTGYEY